MADMTDDEILAKIKKTRDNYIDLRYVISKSPKPDYNIDGQIVKWVDYLKFLNDQIEALTKEINDLEVWEIETQAWT